MQEQLIQKGELTKLDFRNSTGKLVGAEVKITDIWRIANVDRNLTRESVVVEVYVGQ